MGAFADIADPVDASASPTRAKRFADIADPLPAHKSMSSQQDVRGGAFDEQSEATRNAILADMKRTGATNATVNGMSLDGQPAPQQASTQSTQTSQMAGTNAGIPDANISGPRSSPQAYTGNDTSFLQYLKGTASAITAATTGMVGGLVAGAKNIATLPGDLMAGRPHESLESAFQRGSAVGTYTPADPKAQDVAQDINSSKLVQSLPAIGAVSHTMPSAIGPAARMTMDQLRAQFSGGDIVPRVEPQMGPTPANVSVKFPGQEAYVSPTTDAAGTGGVKAADFKDYGGNGTQPLGLDEQARRAAVLQSVGLDSARSSSVTGNGLEAANDAQTAKLNSPSGALMKAQLDNEKQTLGAYADKLVENTGGTTTPDQTGDYARGNNVDSALQGIKDWYDGHISSLYKIADERAKGVPTNLEGFQSTLADDSHLTNPDRVTLRPAVTAFAKKLGVIGDDGSITANAQQAETLRKYLNKNWSPQNSGFVGALKDALDDDVTKSAGEDVYGAAREMRTARGATLDNPNGIAKIMDSSGPGGINRKVNIEQIPQAIAAMGVDQMEHVVNTLKSAPDEVQPNAQLALSELKAHFANQIRTIGGSQAGQFNAKGVGAYLRNNAEKMNLLFSPEEMANFKNLHEAGQILSKDQSYPGAAVQSHNLIRTGVMGALPGAGATAGAAVGGPIGGFVGGALGAKAANLLGDRANLKAVQSRLVNLRDTGK